MNEIETVLSILATGVGLFIALKKSMKIAIKEELEPIQKTLKEARIKDCKNYLVSFLADVENGEDMSVEEVERAYEVYEEYTEELGQNHYVKDQWKRLMRPYKDFKKENDLNR